MCVFVFFKLFKNLSKVPAVSRSGAAPGLTRRKWHLSVETGATGVSSQDEITTKSLARLYRAKLVYDVSFSAKLSCKTGKETTAAECEFLSC